MRHIAAASSLEVGVLVRLLMSIGFIKRSMQIQEIIRHIFNYPFPSNHELVTLANSRCGFTYDTYSITYPHDANAGDDTSNGCVEVCCQGWTSENTLIAESEYLQILKEHLRACNSPLLGELVLPGLV